VGELREEGAGDLRHGPRHVPCALAQVVQKGANWLQDRAEEYAQQGLEEVVGHQSDTVHEKWTQHGDQEEPGTC